MLARHRFPLGVRLDNDIIALRASCKANTATYKVGMYQLEMEIVGGQLTIVSPKWAVDKYRHIGNL